MHEDGTTHVKGKQAKAWNGASLSDHLSAHCHHSFSFSVPVPLTLRFQICTVHRNKSQPLPMKTVTVFPLLQPFQSSRT